MACAESGKYGLRVCFGFDSRTVSYAYPEAAGTSVLRASSRRRSCTAGIQSKRMTTRSKASQVLPPYHKCSTKYIDSVDR